MKKALCLLLCLLMLLPFSFACAGNTDDPKDSNADTTAGNPEDTGSGDEIEDALAQIDIQFKNSNGNNTFLIITRKNVGDSVKELWQEEQSSEPLEQAVYLRNTELEDLCSLVYKVDPQDNVNAAVKQEIQAGQSDLCIAFPNMIDAGAIAADAKLYDFNDVETLNLDGRWWDQGTRELTLKGGVYFMNSDVNYSVHGCSYLTLYSKKMAETKNIPNLYDMVDNNEWTLDKMISLMEDVANDVNGDGKADAGDDYGLITTSAIGSILFYGIGLQYIKIEDGEPMIAIGTTEKQKISEFLDKVETFIGTSGKTWVSKSGEEAEGQDMFSANQSLFYMEIAGYILNLRKTMTDPFGVLPLPKWNSQQENYLTWTNAISSTMVIPKIGNDNQLNDIGTVIEAMALLSLKHVRPAFYDTNLVSKGTRDEDSARMLDILFAHRVYDMAQYYDSTFGMAHVIGDCVLNPNTRFESTWTRKAKNFDKNLKRLLGNLK